MCILMLFDKVVYKNVNYIDLIDDDVEFSYVLTDFLPAESVQF